MHLEDRRRRLGFDQHGRDGLRLLCRGGLPFLNDGGVAVDAPWTFNGEHAADRSSRGNLAPCGDALSAPSQVSWMAAL